MRSPDVAGAESSLPLWKAIAFGIGMFGPLAAILAYIPRFSSTALAFAVTFFVVGISSIGWASKKSSRWGSMVGIFIISTEFLAVGYRVWTSVIGSAWIWFLPVLAVFLILWLLPWIRPDLSKYIWVEQTAPESRAGRLIMRAALSILPVSGVLGASIGLFGSRNGGGQGIMIVAGLLMSVGGLAIAQAAAHQFWPERARASDRRGATES
jgi:hypothetical protein